MEKLTYLEQKFIFLLSVTTVYPEDVAEMVYRRCKSFDHTIRILEEAQAHAVDLNSILADSSNGDVIRRLKELVIEFERRSNDTLPLPENRDAKIYAQGKQHAYSHAYYELRSIIDLLKHPRPNQHTSSKN